MAVLLVDDEPDILETLEQLVALRFPGVEVRTAASGQEALTKLEGVKLIISDFRMPGMNGIEFLTKAQETLPGTPAILLTAFNERQGAVDAARNGIVRRYYNKPPNVEVLLGGIEELLNPESLT